MTDLISGLGRQLVDNLENGILLLDQDDRILDVNPASQRLLACARPLVGEAMGAVLPAWESIKASAGEGGQEIEFVNGDGQRHFLHVRLVELADADLNFRGRVLTLYDTSLLKQAEQAEHEQRALAEALRDTVSALNSMLEIESILDVILTNLGRVVRLDAANIGLVDERGVVRVRRWQGYKSVGLYAELDTAEISLTDVFTWRQMAETRRPIVIPDVGSDPHWAHLLGTEWIGSYMGAPIIVRDRVIGFINVDSAQAGFYTPEMVERLQAFADEVAVAIEKASLFAEIRRRAEAMETVYRIGLATSTGLDVDRVLVTLLEQCREVLPVDIFYIAFFDAKTGVIDIPLLFEKGEYNPGSTYNIRERRGLTAYVIEQRKTLIIQDTLGPDFTSPAPLLRAGGIPARTYVGIPLILRDKVVGVISMQNYQPAAYSSDQVQLLETIATQAAMTLENARMFKRMEQLATIDSLTDLYNRRQFLSLGAREIERSRRHHQSLCAIMMDIDYFKHVNDAHGHASGDRVLAAVALVCRQTLRSIDIVGRYGGDEIVILLPETELEEARLVAERLRLMIETREVQLPTAAVKVSASFGVATLQPKQRDILDLLDQADKAMYTAKKAGRNLVKVAD